MIKAGDLVTYVRPHPDELGLVHRVTAVMEDDDGTWVRLAEEPPDSIGPPVEIEPGIYGGCGGWEQLKEFKLVEEDNA